jgi:hypothetical protein
MPTAETASACTLPSDALQPRLAWIRRVTTESLVRHRLEGNTLHLTYRREASCQLEKIVAEEQRCCTFLRFSLRELADGVELEIQAPGGVGADALWLFDQFLPSERKVAERRPCGCAPGGCG